MGTWDVGIFDSDLANDVRDGFITELRLGSSEEEATQEITQRYLAEREDTDDAPIFWMALAGTQWELGRLSHEVGAKALEYLNHPLDDSLWGERTGDRLAAQAALEEKLKSPQPKKKRIKKWKQKLHPGDVFSLRPTEKLTFYGRVLVVFPPQDGFPEHAWAVYYAKRAVEQAMQVKRMKLVAEGADHEAIRHVSFELEDVLYMDIGLVAHYPSEYEKYQPTTIGHVPLEDRFNVPMHVYRRLQGEECTVFDVLKPKQSKQLKLSEIPANVPAWNDFGGDEALHRLGAFIDESR